MSLPFHDFYSIDEFDFTFTQDNIDESNTSAQESEGELQVQRPPCTFCSYLHHEYFNKDKLSDMEDFLFHRPCDTCPSQPEPESLCDFCQHLRLYHLLICLKDRAFSLRLDFYITSRKWVAGTMKKDSCAFCCVMKNAIASYLRASGQHPDTSWDTVSASLETGKWYYEDALEIIIFERGQEVPMASQSERMICIWTRQCGSTPKGSAQKSIMEDRISWGQIQDRIGKRNKDQESSKISRPLSVPEEFRLIDVKERRVTSKYESDLRFVALSYVWGEEADSKEDALLIDNEAELEKSGGLKNIPRGIEDALAICKALDRRYLWVDRYCIIQNDEQRKQCQIRAMADTSSSAKFTIVNASGHSMHDPISGITTSREVLQANATIFGLEFTNAYPDVGTFLRNTTRMKRGWTYQEAVLSTKTLLGGTGSD